MLQRITAVLMSCVVLGFTTAAHAELVITITKGGQKGQPIAIVPFGWSGAGALPLDIAQVVESDLQRSGKFEDTLAINVFGKRHRLSRIGREARLAGLSPALYMQPGAFSLGKEASRTHGRHR